jgi:hypothetical protein
MPAYMGPYGSLDDWAYANQKSSTNWQPSMQERDSLDSIDRMLSQLTALMNSSDDVNYQLEILQKIIALEDAKSKVKTGRAKESAAAQQMNEATRRKKVVESTSPDGKKTISQSDEWNMTGEEAREKLIRAFTQQGMNPSQVLAEDARSGGLDRASTNAERISEKQLKIEYLKALNKQLEVLLNDRTIMEARRDENPVAYEEWKQEVIKLQDEIRRLVDLEPWVKQNGGPPGAGVDEFLAGVTSKKPGLMSQAWDWLERPR